LGIALVAGRKRVPSPAAGMTALVTGFPKVITEPYKGTFEMKMAAMKDK
jgi:hypothetical protein